METEVVKRGARVDGHGARRGPNGPNNGPTWRNQCKQFGAVARSWREQGSRSISVSLDSSVYSDVYINVAARGALADLVAMTVFAAHALGVLSRSASHPPHIVRSFPW